MTNEDKQDLLEATLIQQAMNDKYLNVKRFLRNMTDVEDHYTKTEGKEDLGAMLKAILNKQSKAAGDRSGKVDNILQSISDRLDQLEARGQ